MDKNAQLWSDEELFRLLQNDDRHAFEIIYNRYVSKLYLSAYSILRDEDLCKDLVQEVLVQLWIRRGESNIVALQSYLFTAVRYKVLKAVKLNARKTIIEEGELERLAGFTPDKDKLTEDDISRLLDQGIAELPEKCREIFILSRKEYLTNKEIADRLGIATKTVENQMTIALRRLRVVLKHFLFFVCFLTFLFITIKQYPIQPARMLSVRVYFTPGGIRLPHLDTAPAKNTSISLSNR
ncbi:MAG: RNA polymerase sigma-70 factor [Bacteroidota bacterium]